MNGAGRIYKRKKKMPNGTVIELPVYWISYYYRGKEFRESSHSESEVVARRLLRSRLGEVGRGKLIGPIEEKVAFEQMADDLQRDYEINGKRSIASVKLSRHHLEKCFAFSRAVDISTDKVRAYISRRQSEGSSNASINRELAALKRMFTLSVQAGKLNSSPYIPSLQEDNARQGFVDHGGFLALRENLVDYLKDPIEFLYLSGWRVSEMRALEWRDVDLEGAVIRLRPEISKNKDGRLLPLSGELLEIIERAGKERRPDCLNVFHLKGQPIGDFRKTWQRACCEAGLGRMEVQGDGQKKYFGTITHDLRRSAVRYVGTIPHDLRRTAVRNMVRAGIPERVAMSLTGHKTRSIFDRYNIVSESDLAQAQEKLQAHLREQPEKSKVSVMKRKKAL